MGDVIVLTKANGEIFAAYVYDEWGSLLSIETLDSASHEDLEIANSNPLRYRGYYYDTETGYYYLQSRYYDPSVCRFINADDYDYLDKNIYGGCNVYWYVNNDPINNSDPTENKMSKYDVAILLTFFIAYYLEPKKLKGYKFEASKMYYDSTGLFIAKIKYYKNRSVKKSFNIVLGEKGSWGNRTVIDNNLNMSTVKYHSNYITSEMSKSRTVYLNGKGSNLISSCVSGCVIGCYLLSAVKKAKTIKTYYNKVWAKNGLSKNNKYRYYLISITKGNSNINGWYAYKNSGGKVTKL